MTASPTSSASGCSTTWPKPRSAGCRVPARPTSRPYGVWQLPIPISRGPSASLSSTWVCGAWPGHRLQLPSLLLLGPPGVGKTHFARSLAATLDLHLRLQSMADMSAGWVLTGLHRHWSDAAPGVIATLIGSCPPGRAPLILLDELDKAKGERRYACDVALLGLLESSTARTFRDENLDLEMNASPLSFLLTANRAADIRPELLSRLQVIPIAAPTLAQMPAVTRAVDAALRAEYPALGQAFAPLDEDLLGALATAAPRALKQRLLGAYARVIERESDRSEGLQLGLQDLKEEDAHPQLPQDRPKTLQLDPRIWRFH